MVRVLLASTVTALVDVDEPKVTLADARNETSVMEPFTANVVPLPDMMMFSFWVVNVPAVLAKFPAHVTVLPVSPVNVPAA